MRSSYGRSSSTYNSSSYSLPFSNPLSSSKLPTSSTYASRRLSSNSTSGTSFSTDQNVLLPTESGKDAYGSSFSSQNARPIRKSSVYSSPNSDRKSPEPSYDKFGQRYGSRTESDGAVASSSTRSNSWRGSKDSREENSTWMGPSTQRRMSGEKIGLTNRSDSVDVVGSSRNRTSSLDSEQLSGRFSRAPPSDPRRASLSRQAAVELPSLSAHTFTSRGAQNERDRKEEKLSTADQQMFLQRLLQAHNIVDDLLRSRGMKPEDERSYLRMWEQIPIIREEVIPTSRLSRSSSASDSGLSLDNDSDQSQHTDLLRPPEECNIDTSFSRNFAVEIIEFAWFYKGFLFEEISATMHIIAPKFLKKLPEKREISEPLLLQEAIVEVFKPLLTPNISKAVLEILPPVKVPEPKPLPKVVKVPVSEPPSKPSKEVAEKKPATKISQIPAPKVIPKSRENAQLESPKKVKKDVTAPAIPAKTSTSQSVQQQWKRIAQRSTLARFQGPRSVYAPGSAEISVQHVSFYQVASSLVEHCAPAERSVRVHLRLTQRASPSLDTSIVVILKLRVLHVTFRVCSASKARRRLRRSHTIDPSQLSRSRSPSSLQRVVPAHARRKEAINPVRIPESFLKPLRSTSNLQKEQDGQDSQDEIRMARGNLKRVAFNKTISHAGLAVYWIHEPGFHQTSPPVESPVERRSPAERSNGVIRKEVLKKPDAGRYSQKGTFQKKVEALLDSKRKNLRDSKSEGTFLRRPAVVAKEMLIKEETAVEVLTPCVYDSVDRKLISEYRRSKVIPKPATVSHVSNTEPLFVVRKESKVKPMLRETNSIEAPPPATFLHRKTPERIVPPENNSQVSEKTTTLPAIPLRPLKLVRTRKPAASAASSRNCVAPPKDVSNFPAARCLFGVTLKRVDRSTPETGQRGAVTHSTPKNPWVPKWRRVERASDEDEGDTRQVAQEKREKEKSEDLDDKNETLRKHRDAARKLANRTEAPSEAEKTTAVGREGREREEVIKLQNCEKTRRSERKKKDDESKSSKEKQECRRCGGRQAHECEPAEGRRQQDEERKKQNEEERKTLADTKKRKKNDQKHRRKEGITLGGASLRPVDVHNVSVPTKADSASKSGKTFQAKQEVNSTKDERDETKRTLSSATEPNVCENEVASEKSKGKFRTLHRQISRVKGDKCDPEQRPERRECDVL